MPIVYDHDHEREITLFAETNFRNQHRRFGIRTDDRRRHMYVLGKTGMGKTTLLENLILSDIIAGHGCCYIDPHGDTAEKLIDFIPSHRINDVVYFNPADTAFPMGFNILETDNDDQKPLVASGLMGVFKKIWPDVWSARMEYILMNCVLALLDYPGATLLGITRLLVDKEYRARVTAKIRDPIVKTFWVAEFASWSEKYATEAIAPVQNKVGQFLSSSVVRNIVAQVKSTINFRQIMDDGKICVVNLSKGRIGEDNMRLLGGMVVTKIQLAAQERQNITEHNRRDFYLYVDEFQNFANESFATILSEARKYRLNLTIAHQYIEQLDEKVAPAIIGNVGTIILMRIGGTDAQFFETEFSPTFTPEDMVSLAKYQIYLKLMVDGVATPPFSANTMAPIAKRTGSTERVIQVSRERYAEPRANIEEKVLKWSGFEVAGSTTGTTASDDSAQGLPISSDTSSAQPPETSSPGQDDLSAKVFTPPPPSTPAPDSAPRHYPRIETDEEREQREASVQSGFTPAPSSAVPSTSALASDLSLRQVQADSRGLEESDTAGAQEEYLLLKPERLAAIAAVTSAAGGKKKERPKFVHTCSRCGKTWELAIQLDPSRPMYCPECRPIVLEEKKNRGSVVKQITRTPPPPELTTVHHKEVSELSFAHEAQLPSAPPASKPRIVHDSPSAYAAEPRGMIKVVVDQQTSPERLSMLEEIAQSKNQALELDKKVLEARAGEAVRREPPPRRDDRPARDDRPREHRPPRELDERRRDDRAYRDDRSREPRRDGRPPRGEAKSPRRDDRPARDDRPREHRPPRERDEHRHDDRPPREERRGTAPQAVQAQSSSLSALQPPVPASVPPPPALDRSSVSAAPPVFSPSTGQGMPEGLGSRPVPPSTMPPANSATAKVLDKLLDRSKPSSFKQVVQAEPPPFPASDDEFGDLDIGLDASSVVESSSAPPSSQRSSLQPGQRVTF